MELSAKMPCQEAPGLGGEDGLEMSSISSGGESGDTACLSM